MKLNHYIVEFDNVLNTKVFASASNQCDALILAQAVMIRNCLVRDLKLIKKVDSFSYAEECHFI